MLDKNRKYLLTVAITIVNSAALFYGKLDAATYGMLTSAILTIYVSGNVSQKVMQGKTDNVGNGQ